jgi:hypothetical protein
MHILIGNPERERLLRRPSRRWENNIRVYLREMSVDYMRLSRIGYSGGLL